MRTWIWPFSWYFRIRELEESVASLSQMNRELTSRLAAESIAHTSAMNAYAVMMEGMLQDSAKHYKRMAEWSIKDAEFKAEFRRLSDSAASSQEN